METKKTKQSKCSFQKCRRKPVFVSQEPLSPQTCLYHIPFALRKWNVTALIPINYWNSSICPDGLHPTHVGCRKGTPPAFNSVSMASLSGATTMIPPFFTDLQASRLERMQYEQDIVRRQQLMQQQLEMNTKPAFVLQPISESDETYFG